MPIVLQFDAVSATSFDPFSTSLWQPKASPVRWLSGRGGGGSTSAGSGCRHGAMFVDPQFLRARSISRRAPLVNERGRIRPCLPWARTHTSSVLCPKSAVRTYTRFANETESPSRGTDSPSSRVRILGPLCSPRRNYNASKVSLGLHTKGAPPRLKVEEPRLGLHDQPG